MSEATWGAVVGLIAGVASTVIAYALSRMGTKADTVERRAIELAKISSSVETLCHDVAILQDDVKRLASKVAGVEALLSAFVKVEPKRADE